MVSNIAPQITEKDIRTTLKVICERCKAPDFSKVQLISALRVAYIVFPSVEAALTVFNVSDTLFLSLI